jgi:hypothetical protein
MERSIGGRRRVDAGVEQQPVSFRPEPHLLAMGEARGTAGLPVAVECHADGVPSPRAIGQLLRG